MQGGGGGSGLPVLLTGVHLLSNLPDDLFIGIRLQCFLKPGFGQDVEPLMY